MENIKVLDVIIAFIKAMKDTPSQYYFDDGTNRLWGAKYLLGQSLRQYRISDDHIFISVAAKNKWQAITDADMRKYNYTMQVPVCRDCELDLYKGAACKPFEIAKKYSQGDTFEYRQVFHDEHVIPIHGIIQKLTSLEEINYNSVQKILDNIYLCRMLKSENIKLNKGHKSNRDWNVKTTIEEIYFKKCNIEICNWAEIKEKI